MNRLEVVLERFHGKRVVVFGDLVADVFVYGEISRISREAPVLILKHKETQIVPGGGANAINNLASLGAKPIPVGIVGEDVEGQ
jgi:bifunctional ADP-heptose synthase (sugar kinase/adenylyltransferase)